MKESYKYVFILTIFVVVVSCDDFLDVDAPSALTEQDFWNSSRDANQGVAAVYDQAQSVFQSNFLRYGEFRADNYQLIDRPSADVEALVLNRLTLNTAGSDWGVFYRAIAHANVAIQNIQDMAAFEGQDDLLAQALTLRALFYFWAVRTWGDVPKISEPVRDAQQDLNIPRTPTSEIFNDIILPDLQRADQLVFRDRRLNHISRGAILALKAHVYMWPGDHQDFTRARDIISELENFGYSLETTQDGWINNIFQEFGGNPEQNSDEIIFALAWNLEEDGANGGLAQLCSTSPNFLISDDFRQKWNDAIDDDFRRDVSLGEIIEPAQIGVPEWNTLNKYCNDRDFWGGDLAARGDWRAVADLDLIFYRLSGLLLLKAEAENYLNNPAEALALINRIRSARGLELVDETITDQTTIRDMILDERRWELAAEGHRYWDLVRNGIILDVMEPINGMNDERRILWPVSQNVMNRNPAINQTDGY